MKRVGIYDPLIWTKGGGEKVVVAMAECLARNYEVYLITRTPVDKNDLANYFKVDLGKVGVKLLPKPNLLVRGLTYHKIPYPQRFRSMVYDFNDFSALKKLKLDIFINSYYQNNCPAVARLGIYVCMFPQRLKPKSRRTGVLHAAYYALMNGLEDLLGMNREKAIDSYKLVLANSQYTRRWIKEYWQRDSKVLYPICEDMSGSIKKEKIILNVGRFFADSGYNHHKRQDILVKAFKKMTKLHEDGWQLHLAGTLSSDFDYLGSLEYVANLLQEADGFPIYIHLNAKFNELAKLYQKASIYWHATGYGADNQKYPERQEHFGITTVEAMSAGAVPVVINSAGQKETVEHEKSGFLWNDLNELQQFTAKLIYDDELRLQFSHAAIESSKRFNKASFAADLKRIMTEADHE